MKVRLIPDRCQGHGMCRLANPEIFELDDVLGNAFLLSEDVAPELEQKAVLAQAACPENAIEIVHEAPAGS